VLGAGVCLERSTHHRGRRASSARPARLRRNGSRDVHSFLDTADIVTRGLLLTTWCVKLGVQKQST
jgi:hypothetical protein